MRSISLNLSKYRLNLRVTKRRGDFVDEPILPTIEELKHVRAGSVFSRIFRHIFEHKNVKKLLGSNIALAIIMASVVPGTTVSANEVTSEQTILKAETTTLTTNIGVRYPINEIKVNQGFRFFHPGIDFEGRTGDEVRPMMAGVVSKVQYSKILYGNAVIIDHGDGLTTLYAHLSKISVKEADRVDNFTKIGEVGSTGRSTGDHLHFEVHKNGRAVNPLTILPSLR